MKKRLIVLSSIAVALGAAALTPLRSAMADTYQKVRLLVDILDEIHEKYVEETDTADLIYGAAAGMVRSLDPFSQFLEPEVHREMMTETSGHFGGVGLRIAVRDGWLTVITPMPDTPAYRQGILPGDKVVKIDGAMTQGLSLTDAVEKLRGRPKTKVVITVFREGDKDTRDFTIIREVIQIRSSRSRLLDGHIGYMRLSEFIEPSAGEMARSLKDLSTRGMTALVLDLRNNPGGLLTSAVDVGKLFIGGNKLVVYTQGRASPRQDFKADGSAAYADLPLAVLVNHGSASASEIVAGVLQDHHRAILLGVETFGKGSVQSIIKLNDGSALRLTTAKYYTPSGRSIHRDEKTGKGGITPDIVIEVTKETEAKLQAQGEEIFAVNKTPQSPVKATDRVKDDVLDRAVEILKAQSIFEKIKR
jgi:carboxyl-terminal processing protease